MTTKDPFAHVENDIEWLDKMLKRWHEQGAPPSQINELIQAKNTLRDLLAVARAAKDDALQAEANCGKYGGARDCSAWTDRGLRCSDCPVEVWLSQTHEALAKAERNNVDQDTSQ